jgi:alpha-tubulin suppressor-like RCC1 family protein
MIGAAHLMMRQGGSQPKGLFVWGSGGYALGLGSYVSAISSPVQVGSSADWSSISGGSGLNSGNGTLWLKSNGTAWACGDDNAGWLMMGRNSSYAALSSPAQIGSDTDWTYLSIGGSAGSGVLPPNIYAGVSAGIRGGKLFTCGRNTYGELGVGDTTRRSNPIQVGSGTDWAMVAAYSSMFAIKTGGTLWAWGYGGTYGVLGLGNLNNYNSPIQVGSDTNWSYICTAATGTTSASALAIKTTGTLWTWGRNDLGQLGLGDLTHRSVPTQVGTDTNWAKVCGGNYSSGGHVLAVKTNGTLWAWGYNGYGMLGLNDQTNRSSPVQVGSDTNWKDVAAEHGNSFAIKTNGTLWAWGANFAGSLGLSVSGQYSSPVQVGSGTNWTKFMVTSYMYEPGFMGAFRE